MISQISAIIASVILLGLMIFQFLLIIGRPLGRYAWGGQHEVLPSSYRVGSAVAIFIYAATMVILLDSAGLSAVISNSVIVEYGIWVLVIYFLLGIPLNAISRSKSERSVMTPIVTLLFVLTLIVAVAS